MPAQIENKNKLNMMIVTISLFTYLCALFTHWYSIKYGRLFIQGYGYAFTLIALGTLLSMKALFQRKEYKLAALFVIWYMLTRIMSGMFFLEKVQFNTIFLIAAMCIAFVYPSLVSKKNSVLVETIFGIVVIGFFTAVAWLAIYAVVTKQVMQLQNATFTIELAKDRRLWIWFKHPNVTAGVYSICYLAVLYHLARQKKPQYLLVPAIVACASAYVMIALTVSRTAMILIAILTGVIIALWVNQLRLKVNRGLKIGIVILVAVISVGITYTGYSFVNTGIERLAGGEVIPSEVLAMEPQPQQVHQMNSAEIEDDEQAQDELASMIATRPLEGKWGTLNGRTDIYMAVVKTLIENPKILLIGSEDRAFMPLVNLHLSQDFAHTHNAFLQVLMTCGIVGLAIMVWLVFLFVKKGIGLIFKRDFRLSDIILGMIPLLILTHALLEPFIFNNYDMVNYLFFAYAGMMVNRCAERQQDRSA